MNSEQTSDEKEAMLGPIPNSNIESLQPNLTGIISDELSTYYNFTENQIVQKIKFDCQIDSLIFKGRFEPSFNKNFGFFRDVEHQTGRKLTYPIIDSPIDSLFIATNKLEDKKYYTFELKISRKNERLKQGNPFLLQAKEEEVREIIQLSELDSFIIKRQTNLEEIEKSITEANTNFTLKLEEFDTSKKSILQKHTNDLAIIQEQYKKKCEHVAVEQARLNQLTEENKQMNITLNLLSQKVALCQNLDFLTEEEADSYLIALDKKSFSVPENHLHFKTDLNEEYPALVKAIHNYLHFQKQLIYTEFQIRNFLALLLTNDIIVLSGLSGSGKTQIVKAFAEAVGGVAKIIPVKPSWTSSDDLLGYYNPLQSSFMPTPFTEAIVEAAQNPHRLYLICLDEMNLARVEYYFADFLSKLEEREQQPEIELYAKHEEEMFAAEFKTMLTLIEASIGNQSVNSWSEFLTNDSIRNRFFELLGASEKDTVLHIHTNMKKRLINILKFPSTLKIPTNVRFIGAINVDETTHYFSPKILDRVHIVKFENPLLIEEMVYENMEYPESDMLHKPIYVDPMLLIKRLPYPTIKNDLMSNALKEINKRFLLQLNIDFGARSLRQSIQYIDIYTQCNIKDEHEDLESMSEDYRNEYGANILFSRGQAASSLISQKIFPRFVFDGDELAKNGIKKIDVLEKLAESLPSILNLETLPESTYEFGVFAAVQLRYIIEDAKLNNNQVNFFA